MHKKTQQNPKPGQVVGFGLPWGHGFLQGNQFGFGFSLDSTNQNEIGMIYSSWNGSGTVSEHRPSEPRIKLSTELYHFLNRARSIGFLLDVVFDRVEVRVEGVLNVLVANPSGLKLLVYLGEMESEAEKMSRKRIWELVPTPITGMWVGEPERERGVLTLAIVNVDTIARTARSLPIYGITALPENFHISDSLDAFDHC
ncbi:hypothetical protein B0H16DRAFT_1693459 [Mycena metata]|uniref:Uncharacterized protein n=1 Tax=Mycena metata TaxID=1033252 RepID=A0AAD7IKU4_9AGAR|nr:hypothetical protein B0H16DRAFT_1693459 [Mycena metata]